MILSGVAELLRDTSSEPRSSMSSGSVSVCCVLQIFGARYTCRNVIGTKPRPTNRQLGYSLKVKNKIKSAACLWVDVTKMVEKKTSLFLGFRNNFQPHLSSYSAVT